MKNTSLTGLTFMPAMVDGETLYSWSGHYHRLSGNVVARTSSVQLFGDKFAGLRWDLPSPIGNFVEATNGSFGNADDIIFERSLFGFYAPFKSEEIVRNSLEQLKTRFTNKIKTGLGIHASNYGFYNPLKACPDCVKEDMKRHFISKWYLEHQWPTSCVCRKHHTVLRVIKSNLFPAQPSEILLPQDIAKDGWEEVKVVSARTMKALTRVVDFSANVALQRECKLDSELLRYTYMLGAKNRGWQNSNVTVSTELTRMFNEHYAELEGMPGFERINLRGDDHDFTSGLMRYSKSGHHPTCHFLLMAFLFDTSDNFNQFYSKVKAAYLGGGTEGVRDLLDLDWHGEVQRLIEVEKMSVKKAASTLNVNPWQVWHYIGISGLNYHRKRKIRKSTVIDGIEDRFCELASKGLSAVEIGRQLNVRRSTVAYHISMRPQLKVERLKNKLQQVKPDVGKSH
jgi:hypothetical protein